ncbi:MAG TPA: CvpA family protein [Chondromyces sp.]|nr:CvpA family protein [Chondromyces sp.]
MIDIILLIFLLFGVLVGLKRGFILQLVHMTSAIVAIIAALLLRDQVIPILKQWIPIPSFNGNQAVAVAAQSSSFEQLYYGAIAFILVFIIVKMALHFVGSMLNIIASLPIIKQFNIVGGGILGFLEIYIILFILIYIATLIPQADIQSAIESSSVARIMVDHTPFISEELQQLQSMYKVL